MGKSIRNLSTVTRVGLDLAKRVFQVHAVDAKGEIVVVRKLTRSQLIPFFAELPPCVVAMEACSSAHHWGRTLIELGHEVRLIPPAHVKPYVRRNKSDQVDAAAIYEAMSRPGQRFVPVRSIDNQAALMRHRARELLAGQRTAALNALRGHRAVCDESVDPADRQQAFVEAMELLLLRYARVGRSPRKPGGERSALNAAIVCIHDRFGDPDLSVSDLAQAAGLSQFYFMRSFLNATGMTAHSYLVQPRLNAARGRLAAGAQAAAVAVECGFFDQSHLIRHFRRVYGVTPGRYRLRGPGYRFDCRPSDCGAGANGE